MTDIFNRAKLKHRRRELRHNATPAEKVLWEAIRNSKVNGIKFRRQASIGAYVLDFYAPTIKLAIEVDGDIHNDPEARLLDRQRQQTIEELGITFLRFSNNDVLYSTSNVIEAVAKKAKATTSITTTITKPESHTLAQRRTHVTIYTDGACSGNPGPGGYGVVMLDGSGRRRELSAGFRNTTNNRMELLAVIVGLETLKRPCDVTLISDSEYVINAITKGWLIGWQKKGWRKADKKPVANIDLWQRLLPLLNEHNIEFKWTRGHAGNIENERCDELAVEASQMPDLPLDTRGAAEASQERIV